MKDSFQLIKTERLLLRPFDAADLENVFAGLSHPDIIRYYGVRYASLEETKLQLKFFADLEKDGTGTWWAICSADNKVFYGAAGLNNLNRVHKKAELGFWLLVDFWGKGIIAEAIPLICDHGFYHLHLHRIEAVVESKNVNCKHVMKKLKFLYEGTLEDAEIKNGSFISLDIYAKINRDPDTPSNKITG